MRSNTGGNRVKATTISFDGKLALVVVLMALFLRPIVWYLELSDTIQPVGFTTLLSVAIVFAVAKKLFAASSRKLTIIDSMALLVLVICTLIVGYNYATQGLLIDARGNSYSIYVSVVLLSSTLYYLVGRFFLVSVLDSPRILFFSWLAASLFFVSNYSANVGGLDLSRIEYQFKGVFLSLADMFALACLVVIASQEKRSAQLSIIICALPILFFLHSRSSLLAFTFSAFLFLLHRAGKGKFVFWLAVLSPFVTMILMYYAESAFSANQRMIGFLIDPMRDSSLLTRLEQLSEGVVDIYLHPIMGAYGGQIDIFGDIGWYIHNILSYWRQFGLIVFLLVLRVVIVLPLRILRTRRHIRAKDFNFLFLLFMFTAVSVFFSRSFNWYFCWLMVGFSSALVRSSPQLLVKRTRRKSRN